MSTRVMIGIPAFNEESTIRRVVEGALSQSGLVVVIDDGSTDRTSAEAVAAGATVIRHQFNSGKGVAVATLFRHAVQQQADVLVLIDGDGQHDPTEIPQLVRVLEGTERADIVVGSRFHRESTSSTPRIRRLGQIAFNGMTALASGVYCSDSQSGFRAFSRQAFCAMQLSETSFSVESEMQFECRSNHLRLSEVPISCSYSAPPKRNVLGHGLGVLVRLSKMTVQRRTLGTTPASSLPVIPATVMTGDRGMAGKGFDSVFVTTPGD